MAAGIVVVKLIGAVFKIPLGIILGDEGFGHFNNAYVIYNLIQMVSTAGLPVALSKTISEANTLGRQNQVHRVFNVSLAAFLVLGLVSFLSMFLFASPLAALQGDELAAHAVMAMAPTCLFVCAISAFRGYAQGHANMVPTSVSQIIEASGKLFIGLALAYFLMKSEARVEDAAAGGIFGVTAGAALALMFLVFTHIRRRAQEPNRANDVPDGHGDILKRLLIIAVPITIGASIVPITSWLDTAQVQNILRDTMVGVQDAGYYKLHDLVDPVVSAYGAYQKSMAVYNLPASFIVAITASVIPAISAFRARRDKVGAGRIAESSMRIGMLLALPAGVGLTVLAGPIMTLLFRGDTNHAITDPAMAILGAASIFVCIMSISNAILQANGLVNLPIAIMGVGCAAKLGVNYVLVQKIGIVGAPVGTLVCYVIVAVLQLALIKRVIAASPNYARVFLKPMLAAALMGAAAWGVHGLLFRLVGNDIATIAAIAVGGCVYLILVVVLRVLSREDLSLMPKGDKIAKILRL